MEKVYVCSQYGTRGDRAANLEAAKFYCIKVIEEGKVPICPHLFYAGVLNDEVKSQRATGMEMGMELLKECGELRIFSHLSEGMKAEILKAKEMGLPVTLATDMSREKRKEILRELEELMNGKKHHTEEN